MQRLTHKFFVLIITHTRRKCNLQSSTINFIPRRPYRSLGIPHFFLFSQSDFRVIQSMSASCCSLN